MREENKTKTGASDCGCDVPANTDVKPGARKWDAPDSERAATERKQPQKSGSNPGQDVPGGVPSTSGSKERSGSIGNESSKPGVSSARRDRS